MKKIFRIILWLLLSAALIPVLGILAVFMNYHMISWTVHHRIYDSVKQIPFRPVTLVLGAGNYEPEKWINHSFDHRMHTTSQLYLHDKTSRIIVSGMDVPGDYDEPREMKMVLKESGIPDTAIVADYGGNRTWISLQRIHEQINADSIIIVSQHQHLERALFIAGCLGMNAIGMEAEPSPKNNRYWELREYLARVKCIFDCLTYKFGFGFAHHDSITQLRTKTQEQRTKVTRHNFTQRRRDAKISSQPTALVTCHLLLVTHFNNSVTQLRTKNQEQRTKRYPSQFHAKMQRRKGPICNSARSRTSVMVSEAKPVSW